MKPNIKISEIPHIQPLSLNANESVSKEIPIIKLLVLKMVCERDEEAGEGAVAGSGDGDDDDGGCDNRR